MIARSLPALAILLASSMVGHSAAQTLINGGDLALRSSGSASGSGWRLNNNGFVGTYVTLDAPGDVTVTVQAAGQASGGMAPRMNLVVGDLTADFEITAGTNAYEHTFSLPAGTHFIRTDFNNDLEKSSRSLTVGSLSVTGAQVANINSNELALAAANTYIENGRQGDAQLSLVGVAPGTPVHVKLRNHAFNFGTAAANPSFFTNYWAPNPAPGSTAYRYQEFIKSHFNMLVPENAGKWSGNESTRDVVDMSTNDAIVAFAQQHGLRMRQHTLLWGNNSGSPGWVNTLVGQAVDGSQAAQHELLEEINERIAYYVGDGVGDERARDYFALDVLNEGLHQNQFRRIFGDDGLADIYNSVAAAAAAAGADVQLYVNEYNVLQFSSNPTFPFGSDNYANWYREHGEAIEAAGGQVDGYGVQYYALLDSNGNNNSPHSPARMQQVFQNLSLTGKTLALTEFGVQNSGSPSPAAVADVLEDTMRMVFGAPNADTFNMWGFWSNAMWSQATLGALVDANWNLTPAGERFEQLMSEWDTDVLLTADENGVVDFRGFYGDYDITVGGRTFDLALTKGQTAYELVVALAGDFDGDHDVDGDDLALWQNEYGAGTAADANGDGLVDGADFLGWQRQLGQVGSPFTPAAGKAVQGVPEPAGMAWLVAVAAWQGAFAVRRPGGSLSRG